MAASSLLALALCAAQQPEARPQPAPYPWQIVPEDALYGHLSEGNFREPLGVFFEPVARELYVADSKNGRIGIFDAELTPVFTFGGPAVLLEPKAVVVDAEGSIAVLDAVRTELRRFDYRGAAQAPLRFTRPDPGGGPPLPLELAAVARDAAGRWIVAEREENRVWVCTADGTAQTELPPPAGAQGFELVSDIAVSADGLIAVADQRGELALHVYDASGKALAAFGGRDIGLDNFTAAIAVAFDESGYLYAVDLLRHDVKVFTPAGRFVARFGGWFSPETRGRAPGELLYPSDIAIAPGGAIYVAERFGHRVQAFVRKPLPERAGAAPRQDRNP